MYVAKVVTSSWKLTESPILTPDGAEGKVTLYGELDPEQELGVPVVIEEFEPIEVITSAIRIPYPRLVRQREEYRPRYEYPSSEFELC